MLDLDERLALFRSNPFLKDAPAGLLSEATATATELTFDRGEFIYAKNDAAEDFYLLIDGRIGHPEVQAAESQYSIAREVASPGQLFGFAALVQGMPRRVISARCAIRT